MKELPHLSPLGSILPNEVMCDPVTQGAPEIQQVKVKTSKFT
jgi:hypothetical protein